MSSAALSQDEPPLLEFIRRSARATDPETSKLAAERVAPRASAGRMKVLEHLCVRAMTDFELAAATGVAQTSIGKRRGEARDAGWVEVALDGNGDEVRRPSTSGSPAMVWVITESGRDFYNNNRRDG